MKSLHRIIVICLTLSTLTGCGALAPSPVTGFWYTNVSGPITATGHSAPVLKKGTATATSILGLIATGDASIRAAALNGGITQIHYVDYNSKHVFGIVAEYTTIVYGTSGETPTTAAPQTDGVLLPAEVQEVNPEKEKGSSGAEKTLAVIFVGGIITIGLLMVLAAGG